MAGDQWEVPDIAGMLQQRDEETTSQNIGPYEVPLGIPAMGANVGNAENAGYVIDPDYMDVLGLGVDDLVKHRK